MMKLVIFAFLVAAVSAGIVTPIDRCGGDGIPLQLRVENCVGAPPCTIVPDTGYLVEGDFIAAYTSSEAKFKLTGRTSQGDIVVVDEVLGAISSGTTYTASQVIRISNNLSGQSVVARIEVYHSAGSELEICVEAAMDIA